MRTCTARVLAILLAVAALGGAGCTRPNPEFQNDTAPAADQPCLAGARSCSGQTSLVCIGGTFQNDRTCPSGTSCVNGACNPGPSATRCMDDRQCPNGTMCSVFIDPQAPGVLNTFCSAPTGTVAAGGRCQANQDCQSGLCVGARPSASCFQACRSDNDCPALLQCAEVSVTVEGVRGQTRLKACVPRR
jgi:hypothetical protein